MQVRQDVNFYEMIFSSNISNLKTKSYVMFGFVRMDAGFYLNLEPASRNIYQIQQHLHLSALVSKSLQPESMMGKVKCMNVLLDGVKESG